MKFVRFKPNGQITNISSCSDKHFDIQPGYPDSLLEINEDVHFDTHYVLNNKLVLKPSKPSDYHKFNYDNKEWYLDTNLLISVIREKRNGMLLDSDWTDTLSAQNRLGIDLYNKWQIYRQALRDIPQQKGFPENIIWPNQPEG